MKGICLSYTAFANPIWNWNEIEMQEYEFPHTSSGMDRINFISIY